MNRIAIARRITGITATALAEKIGVSAQQVTNWATGLKSPNRQSAQTIAEALGVDIAWIADVPQQLPVIDPDGSAYTCQIIRTEEIAGYGILYHVYLEETGDIVPVILAGGTQLTPTDWQTLSVRSAENIRAEHWMDAYGREAIMVDGLPRVIA